MFDADEFKRLKQFNLTYRSILLGTFFLTVVFDLTVAVEVGLVLACVFFIYRMSSLTQIEQLEAPTDLSDQLVTYGIYGSLFFGAIDKIENLSPDQNSPSKTPKIIVLEMHQLINIDTSGIDSLKILAKNLKKQGSTLIVCAPNKQPSSLMERSGFLQDIGQDNCQKDLESAYQQARKLLFSNL
jgi:SulP family sulfate permease